MKLCCLLLLGGVLSAVGCESGNEAQGLRLEAKFPTDPSERESLQAFGAWLGSGGVAGERQAYRKRYLSIEEVGANGADAPVALIATAGTGSSKAVAIVVSGVATLYGENGYSVITDAFTENFVGDGLFDRAWGGDAEVWENLELAGMASRFVLVRIVFDSPRPSSGVMEGMTSVDGSLSLSAYDTTGEGVSESSLRSPGIGASEEAAVLRAAKRLVTLLEKEGILP